MDHSLEDYDYNEDHNTTAQYYEDSDEGYPSPEVNRYGITFPAGSGAGETTYGYPNETDEHDNEVELEDEEVLAQELAYLTQNSGAVDCYLASSCSAQTYATGASGTVSNNSFQSWHLHGEIMY